MKIKHNGELREMTSAELAEYQKNDEVSVEIQILELKQNLAETDYKAIKYAEGLIGEAEYAEIKSIRQQWRDKINELEKGARK